MKKLNFKIIAAISDIHIGNRRVSAELMKRMLKEQFFDIIKKYSYLDAILVGGDISHTLLSLSSDYGRVYLWFIDKLYKTAKKRGCEIHILEGTPSHDMDHLSAVEHYCDNDEEVKFFIYRKYEIVNIMDNYRMLVLPDKKLNKKGIDHLEKLLKEEVDIILGHGLIDRLAYFTQESENLATTSYHYNVKDMMKNCNGPILFGHIHMPLNIQDKFFYIGSFTKLERGNGTHGFLTIGINDKNRKQFRVEMMPNDLSMNYYNIDIRQEDLNKYDAMTLVDIVREFIKETGKENLYTIKITIGNSTSQIDKSLIIDEAFKTWNNVSINKKLIEDDEESSEEIQELDIKKHRLAYLFDEGLPLEEIFHRYFLEEVKPYNSKYGEVDITIEDIKRLLGD